MKILKGGGEKGRNERKTGFQEKGDPNHVVSLTPSKSCAEMHPLEENDRSEKDVEGSRFIFVDTCKCLCASSSPSETEQGIIESED